MKKKLNKVLTALRASYGYPDSMDDDCNWSGIAHARALIEAGLINSNQNLNFKQSDYDALLGENGNDFEAVSAFHLGVNDEVAENTPGYFIYPFGKNGMVYQKELSSIQEEAAAEGETEIVNCVQSLLDLIAKKQQPQQIDLQLDIKAAKTLDVQIDSFFGAKSESEKSGMVWDIVVMKTGLTQTEIPTWVTKESLKASLPIFNGGKMYMVLEGDYYGHKKDAAKKIPREMVGVVDRPRIVGEEMHATVSILPSEKEFADNLSFLASKDQLNAYQLSIDASIEVTEPQFVKEANATVPVLVRITKASIDVVGEAGAGGKFLRMVASKDEDSNSHIHNLGVTKIMKNKMLALFAALFPVIFAAKNLDVVGIDENDLYSHLYAADKSQPRMHLPEGYDKVKVEPILDAQIKKLQTAKIDEPAPTPEPTPPPTVNIQASLDPINRQIQELRMQGCAAELRASVAESKLPDATQKKIMKQFTGKLFTSAELQDTISSEREYLAQFTNVKVDNQGLDIHIGKTQADKMENALAATILCSGHQSKPLNVGSDAMKAIVGDATPVRSIKELYIQCTGDVNITGNPAKMQASIDSTQFSVIVGNALNKALVPDYNAQDFLADINKVCNIVDLNSIQEQKRIRYGGYSDAPTVAEGEQYLPATSPDDEEAVYTPVKKGFTEDITIETIKKDDINAVNKIPSRVARACVRTFYHTVFGLLNPGVNATIYDAVALYNTAAHVNFGTGALDATYLSAAIARLLAQKEANSNEILGIRPGFLLVPAELEKTAYGLVTLAYGMYNQVPTYEQDKMIQVLGVPYWSGLIPTYGAAAKNWALTCRRQDGVPIEAGFVDGQRTPELFVSNLQNVGSLFTNDKITYKVRFWFGACVVDFRFTDGSYLT